jgi:chromosome segregation ATPase
MEPTDPTLEVLKDIRQELRETRDTLSARIDGTNAAVQGLRDDVHGMRDEVHGMREELSRRIVESEVRTSTAIADLAGTVREMTSVLRAANDLRPRVERCEQDIAEMKRRVG